MSNVVPPLPVSLAADGRVRFHPASSLAIQSLVQDDSALVEIAAAYRERFPLLAARTFWQPRGTFHLNVAILRRLSATPLTAEERSAVVRKAAPLLDWLDEQAEYALDVNEVRLAADGALLVLGTPTSATPREIRETFAAAGFPDQQRIFHVTLGRVLEVLPEEEWRAATDYRCEPHVGLLHVREAMLVDEREGFLHSPDAYDVLRRFTLRRSPHPR